jgi:hypothetical protein
MKKVLIMISIALILTSCKTRQVNIQHKDSTTVKSSISSAVATVKGIDTTRSLATTDLRQTKLITLKDTSGTETVIMPVAGTAVTVDANGTFHGQAESVKTIRHYARVVHKALTSDLQSQLSTIKGIDTTKKSAINTIVKDSTNVKSVSKSVSAKADHGWVWMVLGATTIIAVLVFLYFKIKPG